VAVGDSCESRTLDPVLGKDERPASSSSVINSSSLMSSRRSTHAICSAKIIGALLVPLPTDGFACLLFFDSCGRVMERFDP
jgi:hypothetical protein